MFRKILVISLLFIATVGCTFGVVRITKDNFKNSHTVNLKLALKAEESVLGTLIDTPFTKYRVEMDFTREISPDKLVPTIGRVTVFAATNNAGIERSGFLKIGEKTISLAFGNSSTQSVTTVTTTNATNTQGANNSNSSFGSNNGVRTSSSTYLKLNSSFLLKKEDEDEILKSNGFTIRLYSGAEPITVVIAEDDLDKFKEYLNAKPEAGN
ncbi:hypothetical protein [Leptospira haakeii]|uniref:Lipoprotein n=1 Tax=Leptospira haakeii TaxID=2023198 RepID=A0ABX4PK04_9LEPT|nr:hypothetical protein [Leptospira haakeii]PKA15676.1 hypothetical protein CH363_11715 [Leptospira haakeii]PKA21762.1 hypothetical protein CH377_05315 [Leptospira haakeii]